MATIPGPFLFPAYYQTVKRSEAKRVFMALVDANNVFSHLPMMTENALYKVGQRVIDNVPVPGSRVVGAEPTANFYQPSVKFTEGLQIWAENFDIDRVLSIGNKANIVDPVKFNIAAFRKGYAYALDNAFFNNSPVSGNIDNPDGFTGIKYRISDTNGPAGTSQYGVNPACNFAAGSSLLSTTLSAANMTRFWLDVDRMLAHMNRPDGQSVIMFVAPQVMWLIDAEARQSSPAAGFKITEDVFHRTIIQYKNLQIQSCGLLTPQVGGLQVAPVISTAEDVNGWSAGDPQFSGAAGGPFYTSCYFVARGDGGLTAWQLEEPYEEFEHIPGTRQWRWVHDSYTGLFYEDTRCLGRIYGLQVNGPSLN